MRITQLFCDGCGRKPTFWEWCRGEFSPDGYQDWRHPGIIFKEAGCPFTYENKGRAERLFKALFGRPLPEELSYLCPQCQAKAELELPALAASDRGDEKPHVPQGHFFG